MTVLTEGNLQLTVPTDIIARKFDDPNHGLTHCMKAVDFILELTDRYIFIEFKDPQHPKSTDEEQKKFINRVDSGTIDSDLACKFRDTFLYEWASGKTLKPVYYYVLIAIDTLTDADLLIRTDELKRTLPVCGPKSGVWKKKLVEGCAVFNLTTWNRELYSFPISRITQG